MDRRAARARREAWKQLNVPDALFFGPDGLLPLLGSYKFTVEENTPVNIEVALDPELLGRVFENLLAAHNPETRERVRGDRKRTGSFYTPRNIVDYLVDQTLILAIEAKGQTRRTEIPSSGANVSAICWTSRTRAISSRRRTPARSSWRYRISRSWTRPWAPGHSPWPRFRS